jgi:hypothetical protein
VTSVYNFRYQDVFVLLAQEILVKMQFKHNQVQLEELDDETLDDDVSHESKHSVPVVCFLPLACLSSLFQYMSCVKYMRY